MVLIVGDDVWGAVFGIQCAFPNMEGVAMLNEKSIKTGKITKRRWMVLTVGDDVWGAVFRLV